MNELTQIYKAIGKVSEKINNVIARLSEGNEFHHQQNANFISENSDGLIDVASLGDENNEAITDLANYIANLEARVEALEGN